MIVDFAELSFLSRLNQQGARAITAISQINGRSRLETTYKLDTGWIHDQNETSNIYYSLNTSSVPAGTKPKESDIDWVHGFHVDLDSESTDVGVEKRAMLDDLEDFPLRPSVIIDSGNGIQALWLLKKPIRVTNKNRDLLKNCNIQLRDALAGDKVQSLDHLLRLPATFNHPTLRKIKKGRVKVVARLLEFNELRYVPENFEQPLTSLRSLKVPPAVKVKIREGVGAEDRSDACASVTMSLVRGRHSADEIVTVLTNRNWGISERVYDQAKFRTHEKALKWLREDLIPTAIEKVQGVVSTATDSVSDEVLLRLGVAAKEYVEKGVPAEAPAIVDFLPERKIALFHGASGAGKSFLIAFLIAALASGKAFAHWTTTQPYLCLYLEAEMDETEFHQRAKMTLAGLDNVIVLRPSEWEAVIGEPGPHIDNPAHQRLLTRYMKLREVRFFIAEPLSWLLDVADEMSNDDTKLYTGWLRALKDEGIGVITAHNEGWGQSGRLRGASRIKDSVDLTFEVKGPSRGVFEVTRGKTRTSMPMKPAKIILEQVIDDAGHATLLRRHNKGSRQQELLQTWVSDPTTTNSALAVTFDVEIRTITRDVKELKAAGYLSTKGSERIVTGAGLEWMEGDQDA